MMSLRPVTVITGASAGIGVALARVFARNGHELALAARRDSTRPAGRRPPPWLRAAEEFLRANFMQAIDLRQVAAASGVHPVHLARVFRQFYGSTPGQYVRALRLDWAASQLAAAGAAAPSLASLAQQAGFSDQSHFTRAFKRHTGLTPAQYRGLSQR